MSVAVVGTPQDGVFTSGTGVSYAPGAGSNRVVVLALAHSSSSGQGVPVYTSVQPTYNAINMVQAGSFVVSSTARYMAGSLWYALEANLPGAAQTIVASWSDVTNHLNEADALGTAWTLSGVNQTTPVSATDSGNANSATSIAGAGLASTTGGMVLFNAAFNAGSGVGVTGPAGYTQDMPTTSFDFSGFAMMGHKAIVSGGTETPSVSWTGASAAVMLTANFQQAVSSTSRIPTAGAVTTGGNTPTVTPATSTVIQTFVARRSGILEPESVTVVCNRKIFLPSRKAA
jgi:hypothetical protein